MRGRAKLGARCTPSPCAGARRVRVLLVRGVGAFRSLCVQRFSVDREAKLSRQASRAVGGLFATSRVVLTAAGRVFLGRPPRAAVFSLFTGVVPSPAASKLDVLLVLLTESRRGVGGRLLGRALPSAGS